MFGKKRAQQCHRSRQFCDMGCKKNLVAKPLKYGRGGGGNQAPRNPKLAKNHGFLQCFLVLHKSLKGASTPAGKRPSWELFGALGPQKMHFTCIFTVFFCLQEEKTCIFTWFWGHERATRDPRRNKKQHFTCIFTGFLHLGWKGEGVKEWRDPGVKGSWGAGSWDYGES